MPKSGYTESANDRLPLKQLEAWRKAEEVAREVGVSKHTIYAWKETYGSVGEDARRRLAK